MLRTKEDWDLKTRYRNRCVAVPQATPASLLPCVFARSLLVVVREVCGHLFTRQWTLQLVAPSGRTDFSPSLRNYTFRAA